MRAYLLTDGEFQTPRQQQLVNLLNKFFTEKDFSLEQRVIERGELAFCRGCFDCWTKTPGECVLQDGIAEINRQCMTSDVVIYLCPVVFGQFSSNMLGEIASTEV